MKGSVYFCYIYSTLVNTFLMQVNIVCRSCRTLEVPLIDKQGASFSA